VCRKVETRVQHAWDAGWHGPGEIHRCARCGTTETWGEQRKIDYLCLALSALGIEATVSQRLSWYGGGLIGILEIHQSPIRYVEVRLERDYEGVTYWTKYRIPDSRVISIVSIRSVRVRTFPIFGRVIDVRWDGDDGVTGAIEGLTADFELKAAIISAGAEIAVGSSPSDGWFIRHPSTDAPSAGVLACYEKVARDLIRTKQSSAHGW